MLSLCIYAIHTDDIKFRTIENINTQEKTTQSQQFQLVKWWDSCYVVKLKGFQHSTKCLLSNMKSVMNTFIFWCGWHKSFERFRKSWTAQVNKAYREQRSNATLHHALLLNQLFWLLFGSCQPTQTYMKLW